MGGIVGRERVGAAWILSVAPFDTVSVPPLADRLMVNVARSSVPDDTDRLPPVSAWLIPSVALPDALLIVRLVQVVLDEPVMLCAPVPLKVKVVAVVVMVGEPLFVKLPATRYVFATLSNFGLLPSIWML